MDDDVVLVIQRGSLVGRAMEALGGAGARLWRPFFSLHCRFRFSPGGSTRDGSW
jgi:hypothetical protein